MTAVDGLDGLHNFRDTGGLPLTAGGTTRSGVLFRSDALSGLTQAGLDQLAATDVGVIVDFRTPAERQIAPDRLPDARAFDVVDLSILEGATAQLAQQLLAAGGPDPALIEQAMQNLPTLGDLYVGMLRHSAQAFAQVARLVAASHDDAPTAVLVHCTAGKDRTGVATALMLDAAGTARDAIVADYAASEANLAGPWADGILAAIAGMGLPLTPQLRSLATGTPASAIEQAFAWIEAEHGDSAAYLRSGGANDAELDALRARLRS
ncbi:MAG TPA: tyrosine-protein phosphatase [Microbacterium sp.]|nr:tyrosine-protein phosphatase [Microbacterium sp.]